MKYDEHPLGRPLLIILCYNNGEDINKTLKKIPLDRYYDIIAVDDGSVDNTAVNIKKSNFPALFNEQNVGIGFNIKRGIEYAKNNNYQVVAVIPGNNKNDPNQVDRLFKPIYEEGFDYIQGSRRLMGGSSPDLPLFRRIMVPSHAFFFKLITGYPVTDALEGFRAYRLELFFKIKDINVWQDWLNGYEFETYLHYKVLKLGLKFKEVPVTKSYSHYKVGQKYSHIRPFVDWWNIMKPLLFIFFRIKK